VLGRDALPVNADAAACNQAGAAAVYDEIHPGLTKEQWNILTARLDSNTQVINSLDGDDASTQYVLDS